MRAPRDLFLTANRLRLHLLEWNGGGPTVLLVHGFLEHAHTWDFVAPILADAGYRVLALDWRGHGESEWIGAGGYYHFADYSADLAFLRRQLPGPLAIVGHSMGATATLAYAGAEPDGLAAVVAVDALGPPDTAADTAADRVVAWIADLERVAARPAERPIALDAAAAKLRERFPRFTPTVAEHMARHGTRPVADGVVWRFDPLHQTRSPQPFRVDQARTFWARIRCPVLYVEGGDSPLLLPADERAARLALLRARETVMPGVGHHPQLEAPAALAEILRAFLAEAGHTPR